MWTWTIAKTTVAAGLVALLPGMCAATTSWSCGDADLSGLRSKRYVSPQGNDDESCLDIASACKTIQKGIDSCGDDESCGVLVRYGLYPLTKTIQLTDGVSVYGSCLPDGTVHSYRSVLQAPPGGTPALSAPKVTSPTILHGLNVLGSDATVPGSASIAMVVSDSSELTLRRIQLASGKGADGAPGETSNGNQGGRGGAAYSGRGGSGRACGNDPQGNGGEGANYQDFSTFGCFVACGCSTDGYPAGLAEAGEGSGQAIGGGAGGRGSAGCGCGGTNHSKPGVGGTGGTGQPGACGPRGGGGNRNVWGAFTGPDWKPTSGGRGETGAVGAGGGGGGSGGISALCRVGGGPLKFEGNPGGGGGGGGCGGIGGTGGQQGGASIPLVVLDSTVTTDDDHPNALIPGPGGRGGPGGKGGTGGPGGEGGDGRPGYWREIEQWAWCKVKVPGSGGKGGKGGQGGAGGGGAGGNGGPSIGIALVGSSPEPAKDQGIYGGLPGTGGAFGVGGQNAPSQCKGGKGAEGLKGGGEGARWHKF